MKHYESHKYNVVIEGIQKNLFCIIGSIKTLKRSESNKKPVYAATQNNITNSSCYLLHSHYVQAPYHECNTY